MLVALPIFKLRCGCGDEDFSFFKYDCEEVCFLPFNEPCFAAFHYHVVMCQMCVQNQNAIMAAETREGESFQGLNGLITTL